MEPPARAPQDLSRIFRIRLLAISVLLLGLAFVQSPGLLVPDTKFDLAVAPVDFLGRALHLWDAESAFGQLQNQAYGYLWPMGPFFAGGWGLDVPGWIVQRLWLALVLIVAFTGAARVTKAIGVRSDLACLIAGLAFALSPRMLTTLGPISIEAWPSALAPWVLLPLIIASSRGSTRLGAALSALAIAMVGGVNAAATFAVIPLGAIWLLTRRPGRRRRSLMLWWPLFTLLGTLWWLVPLFLLGAYSPAFLDYIETSSVTTLPTDAFNVLRGTSNWVPYLDSDSRAGHDLITTPYLILDSGVLLLVGLAGILGRSSPHRLFLGLSVLVGMLMVGAGHTGAVEGWFAGDIRGLLDGALAPLRNVHKFDPIIRLPLVIGIAIALDRSLAPRTDGVSGGRPSLARIPATAGRYAVMAMTLVALLGSVAPVATGRLTPAGATLGIPGYWQEAADWLRTNGEGSTSLLVPGSPFGEYVWGSPRDEPLQHLADNRWAVRNIIPLAPEGNIRMLDEIEARFAQGKGSSGLTAYLRRAGVRHLVVRNDVVRGDDIPDPVLVHQALEQSPGLIQVAAFGPELGGEAMLEGEKGRFSVNGGWQDTYPAVEVYEVSTDTAEAVVAPRTTTVAGGPEDLLDLTDMGVLGDTPTVLGVDQQEIPTGPVVLTDGLRERERAFSRIHDGGSATLTAGDVKRTGNPANDYRLTESDRWSTTSRLDGVASISASSSRSDAGSVGGSRPSDLPYAAVDGREQTEWVAGPYVNRDPWWQIDLTEATWVDEVHLVGGTEAHPRQVVRVRTEDGVSEEVRLGPGDRHSVTLPRGATDWVRVEDAGSAGGGLALAEVTIPGVDVVRRLVPPTLPEKWGNPDVVALSAEQDARLGCAEVRGDIRCVPGRERNGEEPFDMRRVVTLPEATNWSARLRVRPVAGPALGRLILDPYLRGVEASSQAVPDPRASALAVLDGDPGTTWLADPDDLRPTLDLRWLKPRRFGYLRVALDQDTAAKRPVGLTLTWPGGRREVELDEDGVATFEPIRTKQLKIQIDRVGTTAAAGFDTGAIEIGTGISEILLGRQGFPGVALSEGLTLMACGTGPDVVWNGRRFSSALDASPAALARGETVDARLCSKPVPQARKAKPRAEQRIVTETRAGENTIDVEASPAAAPVSLTMTNTEPGSFGAPSGRGGFSARPVPVADTAQTRILEPGRSSGVVVLRQNMNPGWQARQGSGTLRPVTVDGWQQGWELRDETEVKAVFTPDERYRTGLVAGAAGVALLVLLVLAGLVRRRRSSSDRADDGSDVPAGEWRAGPVLLTPLAVAGGGLIAGTAGAVVCAVTAAAALAAVAIARRRGVRLFPWIGWLGAAPVLLVAFAYSLRPWIGPNGWAGEIGWLIYPVLVPVTLTLLAAVSRRERRKNGGRSLSRAKGSSTSR
ncbi:DUF3367 domain-containing protein [Nocardioides panzhihuensis]|uniref:Arabinofuranan 3-O-arabinosyltransferase n=1 Tax=Nocardioides panzhihuensis TaxID=860243 RepID=A0A7Z0IR35_9ACTN|nr:DUF3367 domain-containing protein [Nocardioides panzhihuensis]NYI76594.1 arabinofuranan 3-O-arabinosyltransferase [Nocardioides panzhihuensis]